MRRNVAPALQVASSFASPWHRGADGFEQRFRRGHAGGQHPCPTLGVRTKVAVSVREPNQVGQGRFRAVAADAVRIFPDQDYDLSDSLVVDAPVLEATPLSSPATGPPAAGFRARGGGRLRR